MGGFVVKYKEWEIDWEVFRMRIDREWPLGIVRDRESVLHELGVDRDLWELFEGLPEILKGEFLSFCAGEAGVKVCYELMFEQLFHPDWHGKRLEKLLSAVFGVDVTLLKAVFCGRDWAFADGGKIMVQASVKLHDGTKRVFVLVLMDCGWDCELNSELECELGEDGLEGTDRYEDDKVGSLIKLGITDGIGRKLMSGTEYVMIPLEKVRDRISKRGIRSELDAWLGFLACDDLVHIREVVESYPQFLSLYQDIADLRDDLAQALLIFLREKEMDERLDGCGGDSYVSGDR